MDLYLVRHAWAEERDGGRFSDDALRPLTSEGCVRFEEMCRQLVNRVLKPTCIVSSSMLRCKQTAEILAAALEVPPEIQFHEELLPDGDFKLLLGWIEENCSKSDAVACVGHAPDLGYLAASLIGQENGWMRLAKGSIAAIRFSGPPEFGSGELRWLVTAKVLGV